MQNDLAIRGFAQSGRMSFFQAGLRVALLAAIAVVVLANLLV